MIPRYARAEAAALWSPQTKYKIWFEIEAHAADAMAELGVIPKPAAKAIWDGGRDAVWDSDRIDEIERTTKHDVIAFLTHVSEVVGPEARFLHQGMTSSDVLDTGLALAMVQSGTLLVAAQAALTQALKARALEHRDTLCVGRTHGVHAEPTTFGLRLAGFALESRRNEERLRRAHEQIAYGKLSGAVGTYAMLDPAIEAEVMDELGLKCEPIATQVIPRDRHAEVVTQMALAASSLERLAVEIRHLQRTEVREAEEAFGKGQKGSSAMPHKRNPITAERITGLARVIRSNSIAALEDVALWHERDISHSSVERVILPDSYTLLDYLLATSTKLIEGLLVRPERMKQVLDSSYGLVYSQRVLLGLVEEGLTREEAYAAVQRNAMVAWDTGTPLRELLGDDDDVTGKISPERLDSLFDPSHHLRHMDDLMARVEAL